VAPQLETAPAPNIRSKSKYPKLFKNVGRDLQSVFEDFEVSGVLYEYVIERLNLDVPLDHGRRAAKFRQINRPTHPSDRAHRLQQSPNDPGEFRAVTGPDRSWLVGVAYHPVDGQTVLERASLELLSTRPLLQLTTPTQSKSAPPSLPTY
jgi:hypothetical protein